MRANYTKIEGATIRASLRSKGIPGGKETVCCGGKVRFSRDYATQLRSLGLTGNFIVTEKGIVMDWVTV